MFNATLKLLNKSLIHRLQDPGLRSASEYSSIVPLKAVSPGC